MLYNQDLSLSQIFYLGRITFGYIYKILTLIFYEKSPWVKKNKMCYTFLYLFIIYVFYDFLENY